MHVLQTLPAPTVGLCTEVGLYVQVERGARYSFDERAVILDAGDWATTDTYFGAIPTAKWINHTSIRKISVRAEVDGDVEVELVHTREHHDPTVIGTARQRGAGEVAIVVPDISAHPGGHLYLRVRSHAAGSRLLGMRVLTPQEPARDVRLGISVTTFRRPEYVHANMARLSEYLVQRDDLREGVRVLVVDNGRDLALDTSTVPEGVVRVISNRNLGGAGGFARGLMEFRDGGWASHVVFMDDDLTFEPEIVGRIRSVLMYATDAKLCIGGAMLVEEHPSVQFEAGAVVQTRAVHIWQAIASNRDLLEPEDVLANDADEPFDYCGWWCFAFPIDLTADYPLPIFVRGDDVCFGLMYATGHMVTMNGIGVWHQDFSYKNGPTAFFYESRNLPIMLCVARGDVYDAGALRKRLFERVLRFAGAFKYDSAEAVMDGIEAFLDGPDALLAVPADTLNDMLRERYGERFRPLDRGELGVPEWRPPRPPLPYLWRAASLATLNGHLLPARLRRRRIWAAQAHASPAMATIGAEAVVYRHDPTGTGFVAARDQDRFRAVMARLKRVNRRISHEFDQAADSWRAAYPKIVSDGYWRDQFEPHPT